MPDLSPSVGAGGDLGPVSPPSVIPLFPLPNVVFFPRTYLPLHIFEPRYSDMVRYAAAGHRMIGMVLLKDGWESDYHGAPPIFPVGCVGRIISIQTLPEYRYNILLQGLRRFEIQAEVGAETYRQARIDLKDVPPRKGELPSELRAELQKAVAGFIHSREDELALVAFLKHAFQDDVLVNNLSFVLDFTPLEKQFLLESESLLQQGKRLLELLQFKLHERNDQIGWG